MKDLFNQPNLILDLDFKQDIEFLIQLLEKNILSKEEQIRLERLFKTQLKNINQLIKINNELLGERKALLESQKKLDEELSIITPKLEEMKKKLMEELADKNKQINILMDLAINNKKK